MTLCTRRGCPCRRVPGMLLARRSRQAPEVPVLGFVLAFVLPTIWIVDANSGPGTHFTDLPAAVAAAQSGDTILVRSGNYTAFYVTGKALTIRGAGQGTTVINLPTGHATHSHLT